MCLIQLLVRIRLLYMSSMWLSLAPKMDIKNDMCSKEIALHTQIRGCDENGDVIIILGS